MKYLIDVVMDESTNFLGAFDYCKNVMRYIELWLYVLSHAGSGHHGGFVDIDSYKFVHLDIFARVSYVH